MHTLKDMLIRHEGERLKVYMCPAGKPTIGVGRNLEDRGISHVESDFLLDNDIEAFTANLNKRLFWFKELDLVRQAVLVDMAFNMGVAGLMAFKKTLKAIENGKWTEASRQMLDSRWATQVGSRATELAEMMRTGKWA
jgi:lysozyme